jgi:O-antigen/teichoic acid export membrane protein
VVLARSVFFALGVCGLLALLRDGTPAWAALCAQAAAGLLSSVPLVFRPDRWRGAHRLLDGLKTGRDILASQYRYLFAYFFVVAFFSQMDILLLRAWSDPGQLATYGSAFRYYTFLVLSLNAVHTVMLPRLQEVTERSAMRTLLRKQWALAALFLPVVIGLALAAPWFIPWIDGGKYPEAPRVFRILAASSAISFCFSPFVNVVLRLERFFPLLLWAGVALVLDVALNAVLIPRHGAPGAAWATLAAFAFMNIVVFLVARRLLAAGPEPGPGKDSPEGTRP